MVDLGLLYLQKRPREDPIAYFRNVEFEEGEKINHHPYCFSMVVWSKSSGPEKKVQLSRRMILINHRETVCNRLGN